MAFASTNPATGEVVATFENISEAQITIRLWTRVGGRRPVGTL